MRASLAFALGLTLGFAGATESMLDRLRAVRLAAYDAVEESSNLACITAKKTPKGSCRRSAADLRHTFEELSAYQESKK